MSVRSATNQYCRNGCQENLHVVPQAPLPDIRQLKLGPVWITDVAAAANHPVAREAGPQGKQQCCTRSVVRNFLGHDGPRADDRHVTPKYIPELGQLIETRLAQHASDGSDPEVTLFGELEVIALVLLPKHRIAPQQLLGIGAHGAELVKCEKTFVL